MAADHFSRRIPRLNVRPRGLVAAAGFLVVAAVVAGCLPPRAGTGSGSPGAAPATASIVPVPSGPTPRPSYVAPTPTPGPTFLVYTVARGDSLNSIAHRYGTTARSIAFWNRATYPSLDPESAKYRPNLLQLGWTLLVIPNVEFDEQTLPEPSELQGELPSPTPTDGEIQYEDDPSPS
jgi:hypothetical protein